MVMDTPNGFGREEKNNRSCSLGRNHIVEDYEAEAPKTLDVNASVYVPLGASGIETEVTGSQYFPSEIPQRAKSLKGNKRKYERKYEGVLPRYPREFPENFNYCIPGYYSGLYYIPVVNPYRVVDPGISCEYGTECIYNPAVMWDNYSYVPVRSYNNYVPPKTKSSHTINNDRFGNQHPPMVYPELTLRSLEQRQKQINYGKNTIGYKRYSSLVPKDKRTEFDPGTPDKYTRCSKRCWCAMVRSWRLKLHKWDPPEDEKLDNTPKQEDMISQLIPSPSSKVSSKLSLSQDNCKSQYPDVITPFGTDVLKPRLTNSYDSNSGKSSNICVYDEPEEKTILQNQIHNTPFDAKTLEQKLKIWDEKFERCFRAGPVKGELETGSFFSSPFSGFGIDLKTNSTVVPQPQKNIKSPPYLKTAPFSPSVVSTQKKSS